MALELNRKRAVAYMSTENLVRRCWRLYAANEFQQILNEVSEHDWRSAPAEIKNEFQFLSAIALWRLDKYPLAYRKMRRLLLKNPSSVSIRYHLANICDDMDEHDEAQRHYELAHEMAPENSAILADWAVSLYWSDQFEKSLEKFAEAERLCASDSSFYFYRGMCLEAVGEFEAAVEDLETCVALNPEAIPISRLGMICMTMGDFERAEALFRETLEKEPDETMHLYNLALCLKHMGEWDEAEAIIYRLIDRDPRNFQCWGLLGDLELERGNLERAVDGYQRSLKFNPNGSHTLSGLGWVHYRQQNFELARQLGAHALACDPGNISALDLLREMVAPRERLCRYEMEIQGENSDGARFYKSMECLASSAEEAEEFVRGIQILFSDEPWWEIVDVAFIEAVEQEHPGVVWISDLSFCS